MQYDQNREPDARCPCPGGEIAILSVVNCLDRNPYILDMTLATELRSRFIYMCSDLSIYSRSFSATMLSSGVDITIKFISTVPTSMVPRGAALILMR